ncbi:hypothetical protein DVR12_22525 [Chitinophaga silvatica]|uniref:Uncharacterized protein n=1 Tax=Chitinophaga silvatica TaxID=2282649 RepID=A0A3E1Y428_9BACT|nr:hypothetical protein [Chitinophaga silvatica]RFS19413.1 hypothetical protein DVR12_22525 [Chitinophaga silvatica]
MIEKATISALLMQQALDSLLLAVEARREKNIDKEIRLGINIFLLLGITVEGVINEIGEDLIDSWTWSELEKGTTPLKWRILSTSKKEFKPSEEPLQTIIELQKIRNRIAHPKSKKLDTDVIIISDTGIVKKNPEDNYILPEENFSIYIGYEKFLKDFDAKNTLFYMKRVLTAIKEISKLFNREDRFQWSNAISDEIKNIIIDKNEINT